jgi:hypothetical protein
VNDELDDEVLMRRLRRLFEHADPVPEGVLDAARNAFAWRGTDVRFAELAHDTLLEQQLAGSRGDSDARRVLFEAAGLTIDMQLRPSDAGVLLLCQLAPAATAAVTLQTDEPQTDTTIETDALGRFRTQLPVRSCRLRLRVTLSSGEIVESAWLPL